MLKKPAFGRLFNINITDRSDINAQEVMGAVTGQKHEDAKGKSGIGKDVLACYEEV